jgi:hypothetical protein
MRLVFVLLILTACSVAPPEPTPDIRPTAEALVNQRLAEKEREALIEVAVQQQLGAIRATPTPLQTSTPTATPLPTPEPTATPVPTPTPRPAPTATPRPMATPDLGHISWIDRELVLTGQYPLIEWMWGPTPENPWVYLGNTKRWAVHGDRIAKDQEIAVLSAQAWCRLKPTERLKLMEYAVWLGNNIYDWLDQQYGIQGAWSRCPPAGSY